MKDILREWQGFKRKLLNPQEVKKAKDYLKGSITLTIENVHNVASILSTQTLLDTKFELPAQYFEKINKVTAHDLRRVAQDLLRPQNLNLVIVGPHKNKVSFQRLLTI